MIALPKILYPARTDVTGGLDAAARSDDGRLDFALSLPGTPGDGTNPEQLLAAGWSACFLGAIGQPAYVQHEEPAARRTVHLSGMNSEFARALIAQAHATRPYSKAMRGKIDASFAFA